MKTILATTYAVNPYKGSEDAMGWNYVYQVARFNKVIAITRENNRGAIEKYMAANPDGVYGNIRFLYYDLPKRLRWWKRGTWGSMLYFLLWQKTIISFIRKQELEFDITHHLNFHNDWSPSYLWQLGKPFVWGPIGHHPQIPAPFRFTMPVSDKLKGFLTGSIKRYFWNWSKALEQTRKHADYIWCMNDSVPEVLDLRGKNHHISPSVATQDYGWAPEKKGRRFEILSAGRLVHMKGFDLTIRAFARFVNLNPASNARLTIVGDGPERDNLKELTKSLGIQRWCTMINWVPRHELMDRMKESSLFLFPSHEGAGMVVPEALSFGLPVVTLDNYGPGRFVAPDYGVAAASGTYQGTVDRLADAIASIHGDENKLKEMSIAARTAFNEKFDWNRRGETLRDIYSKL
ncbi:glycosyltransferase family 4 protein [Neolewinella aurantiaca]|uniref:Glycosyltransferase family 4 protein n=1 Tax=Neolewinella aurantiaca TaxID=2602767 RepID=A0A5C7FF72_9BACT|nr:glycosyltransferase family 4 protein [Neolewinella aurantiaca]TXF85967.1 glycosyltransferase family 4 protein [Neolewinella aurantiaca]